VEHQAKKREPHDDSAHAWDGHAAQRADRLRIGVMLRGIDEVDGPGVYIRKLCDALFSIDRHNEYVLFYRHRRQFGRYANRPNVREVVLRAPGKLIWDQLRVPLAAARVRLDVLFHHKFTAPMLAPCPVVVQQRGAGTWIFPDYSDTLDRLYMNAAIPLYCRRAARVLTVSRSLAEELHRYAGVPRRKMQALYAAADERFSRRIAAAELIRVRKRYELPDRPFLLMVVKGYARLGRTRQPLYPMKNILPTIQAYMRANAHLAECPPLVVVGPGVRERIASDLLPGEDTGVIHFAGLVEHDDMPAIYSLAHALIFTSQYESFGIPLVEAMTCGCPVITSDSGACREVTGGSALLVDPADTESITRAIVQVVGDAPLARALRQRGRERARDFSWHQSARQLLATLTEVARAT
jgi:glycosyltransferase involved in cell wall biosynthesis